MLDLYSGIHLHEVEVAVLVNEELDSTCVVVAALLSGCNCRSAHFCAKLGAYDRTGALLQHLLVAALHRAVALAEVYIVAVLVGDYLYLHMVGIYEELLDINGVVAEEVLRLLLSGCHLSFKLVGTVNTAYAASAAACRSLYQYGVACLVGNFLSLFKGLYCAL